MSTPSAPPRPYPGCATCRYLLDIWMTATEPASPERSQIIADRMAMKINEHRRQDEAKAPVV